MKGGDGKTPQKLSHSSGFGTEKGWVKGRGLLTRKALGTGGVKRWGRHYRRKPLSDTPEASWGLAGCRILIPNSLWPLHRAGLSVWQQKNAGEPAAF